MFDFNKPLELPPQLQWESSHEPELLIWTIKARNYDLFWANAFFLALIILGLTGATFVYIMLEGTDQFWRIALSTLITTVLLPVITSSSHRRVNISYRLTKSRLEYCLWKFPSKWPLVLLKWLTPVVALTFLFLATVDPAFLLGALICPGGMVLTYLSLAHSRTLQELETEYHHKIYEWADFKAINIATNREVVGLSYQKWTEDKKYLNRWSVNLYCPRRKKERIAELLRDYLARDTPVTRLKADIW